MNDENQTIIELNDNEIEQLLNLTENITTSPSDNPNLYCKEIKEITKQLPVRIQNILTNFAKKGSQTGFLLIRTIPIHLDTIERTPPNNTFKVGEGTILAKIQSILISYIGEMIAYEAEGYGRLFQDVLPMKSMKTFQTSLGSNTELEIHTEQAFSSLRPDILSLACIRGDDTAYTYILPVKSILKNLTEHENRILREPLWKTGVDLSFKLNGKDFIHGDIRGPMPIINGKDEDPFLVFDQDLMKCITKESNNIIEKIIQIYYKERIQHNLNPGEIILIDNNRAVHGRSSFFPRFDGYDRFLIRCFATFDYNKSEYARFNNSRMIRAIYS